MFFTVKLHQARFQDAAIKDDGNDFGAFLNAAEVGQALRTANYCADLKVSCLRFARCFREPTTRDGERIARVARYMRWTADTRVTISPAPIVSGEPLRIACWVDCDWAGHHVSRRSCSGVLLALNAAIAYRRPPALSSGEAELYAIGSGFVETLFFKHFLEELDHHVRAEVRTDSRTVLPICSPNLSPANIWTQAAALDREDEEQQ